MRMQAAGCTDTGRVRRHNEDAFSCDPRLGLFVVCDGMGGESAGEVASRIAVDTIVAQFNGDSPRGNAAERDARGFSVWTSRLETALLAGNRAIFEASQENSEQAGMGSTVVSAWIAHNVASIAHVGDSRAYLGRAGRLEQITEDHSLVEEQVKAGLMTREESLTAQHRNILTRALGRAANIPVDLTEVPLRSGDLLLLCTDGVTQMVSDEMLAHTIFTLQQPQRICEEVIRLANSNGGIDNSTVVVVKVEPETLWRRLWKS
jgi:serine/threonine protein phosphatase PrpC